MELNQVVLNQIPSLSRISGFLPVFCKLPGLTNTASHAKEFIFLGWSEL